ncbi:MAG: hypothetical protein KAH23_01710 [Kiritimatiellae bacterium]|nr:hypothetical protein [Kiritimatiellia bacterium]
MPNEIPAGSGVPEPTGVAPEVVPVEEVAPVAATPDDALVKQVANLEQLVGRQGQELGQLRSFKAQSDASANPQPEEASFDQKFALIEEQLDSGELDLSKALREVATISANLGAETATNDIRTEMQDNKSREMMDGFIQNNPDFETLMENGELAAIMKANPLHDEFSAYYAYKTNEANTTVEDRIAAAKLEGETIGASKAGAAQNATGVLGKQGADVRDKQTPTTFATPADRKQAMIDALKTAQSR